MPDSTDHAKAGRRLGWTLLAIALIIVVLVSALAVWLATEDPANSDARDQPLSAATAVPPPDVAPVVDVRVGTTRVES